MIVKALIETVARSRDCIDDEARRKTIGFIKGKWNRDGGVRGRSGESDLYFTAFAAMVMRALEGPVPKFRLWRYLRSFGDGESLDIAHLFCLIRLRSIFPVSARIKQRLLATLHGKTADSATDLLFKVIMTEYLQAGDRPDARLAIQDSDNTSDLAATAVVNGSPDQTAAAALMGRWCATGGFYPNNRRDIPRLESTAKALFALRVLGADLEELRAPCIDFVESLRRADGGYVASDMDDTTDVENTFYALFSIGCLAGQ